MNNNIGQSDAIKNTPLTRDEIDTQKRELRVLLHSFDIEKETLLEESLDDPNTRRKIGRFISRSFVRPGDL